MAKAFVVTGGGRGIGRAIAQRLLAQGDTVVIVELEPQALDWVTAHPAAPRLIPMIGSAADEGVAEEAADRAETAGTLGGWVNNAAVFRDASLHEDGAQAVMERIVQNLEPAVVGCGVAVRRFLRAGRGGAIINVSSHQAHCPTPPPRRPLKG